jgi:hypothetical protein
MKGAFKPLRRRPEKDQNQSRRDEEHEDFFGSSLVFFVPSRFEVMREK